VKKLKPFIKATIENVLHYLKALWNKSDEDQIYILSSGIAFDFLICIIPFNLILFSVLGLYLSSEDVLSSIDKYLDKVMLLPAEIKVNLKQTIFSRIGEISGHVTITAIIGVLGLLWTASGLFSTLRSVLNKIYKIDIDIDYFRGKLKDIGMVFLLGSLFILSFSMTSIFSVINSVGEKYLYFIYGWVADIIPIVFGLSFSFLMFYIIFRMLPYGKVRTKTALISSFWCSIFWEVLKIGFTIYLVKFSDYAAIYGTYAAIAILIIWIYMSALAFVVGAEIGQIYNEKSILKTI
jgi:membrane protein